MTREIDQLTGAVNLTTQLIVLYLVLGMASLAFRFASGKTKEPKAKKPEAIEKHKGAGPSPAAEGKPKKELGVPASEEEVKRQQKNDIWAESYELAKAVRRGSKIAGKPCDCGFKHALALRYLVDEIPMPEIEGSLSKLREAAQAVIDHSKGYEPYTLIPSKEEADRIIRLLREGRKGLWEKEQK